MPDRIADKVNHKFVDGDDMWGYFDTVQRQLVRHVSEQSAWTRDISISLTTKSGSQYERQTLSELRNLVEEDHLTTEHLTCTIEGFPTKDYEPERKTRVWVHLMPLLRTLIIEVSSPSAVLTNGLAAIARERLSRPAPPTVNAAPPAAAVAAETVPESPPVPVVELQAGWWARTWRDHTALLIITIVGGVAVVAIGAWMFGQR